MVHGNPVLNIPVALFHAGPCCAGKSPMLDNPISMVHLNPERHSTNTFLGSELKNIARKTSQRGTTSADDYQKLLSNS
jgi:hypothetical protein